ncbi:hypothetical protein [Psychrobacter aquimaris]|uniref:hypothetical protein n=1 Tax=Psychrobacter aquimaris TaxID=292733 RepID=UPI0018DF5AA9|nr:hypothetical protein [Psychrobacter aquimaris]
MPKDHKKPNIYLLSEVNVADAPADADKSLPRKFSGVANSGKPFDYYGDMAVIDLSDLTYKDNIPALLLHDRAQRCGFGALNVSNNQLMMTGYLLDNQFGREIAAESDAGFPWQMSVHVDASSTDYLGNNDTATVNGQTVTGPITILRNCSILEVSFTPTGVDAETSALALTNGGIANSSITQSNTDKETTMTPEEIAALQKLVADQAEEIKTLKEEKSELEKEKAEAEEEAKAAAIDAQLSQAGFTKTEDGKAWNGVGTATVNMLLSASPEDAKEMIGDLRAPGKQDGTPEWLLSEQHKPKGNGGQERQLSSNPMLANAEARGQESKNYI